VAKRKKRSPPAKQPRSKTTRPRAAKKRAAKKKGAVRSTMVSTAESLGSHRSASTPSHPASVNDQAFRKWMKAPKNMHAREAILMHRLCLDLQLAAARRGYYLNTYYDDVDHDGFDLIFDDQDYLKKLQVKTVESKAPARQWSIHKRILRPSIPLQEKLGFESSPDGEGTEGGFILLCFDAGSPDLQVRYFYTDVFVWLAFECGVLRRTHAKRRKAVDDCVTELRQGGLGKVTIPKALLLEAKGSAELLALCGLHSQAAGAWKYQICEVVTHEKAGTIPQEPPSLDSRKKQATEEIRSLVRDRDL
jgi:hypothetical protein